MFFAEPDDICLPHKRLPAGIHIKIDSEFFSLGNNTVQILVSPVSYTHLNGKAVEGGSRMHNEMEELLPVVAKLAERYTSKESSSVSYKTAEQLMGAVVYCINEVAGKSAEYMLQGRRAGAASSYEAGYRIVLEKTGRAKEIYHHIIEGFDDYGCKNYKETIASGMPAFFTLYDPVFHPQDHILTLDYPCLLYTSHSA